MKDSRLLLAQLAFPSSIAHGNVTILLTFMDLTETFTEFTVAINVH